MKQRWVIATLMVAALVITAGVAYQAAAECFLKVDGIQGESQDAKHKDEIQVLSWSWGETLTGTSAYGGGGAGRANFKDIIFTARISKASPKLFSTSASGQHIKSAVLTCRNPGKAQLEFLKITLTDVIVSSYLSGYSGLVGGADLPSDQFSFNYSKVNMEYRQQKPDGTQGPAVSGGFDLKQNKAQ